MATRALKGYYQLNQSSPLISSAQQAAAQLAQLKNLQQQLAQQQLQPNMGPSGGNGYGTTRDPLEEDQEKGANSIRVRDLTIPQARDILNRVLKTDIVPFLWGPPGVGKSTLVREICKEQKWQLIDLRLSLLNPVDLRGLPVVDKENRTADWYPPTFLPKYTDKSCGVLFLDEINLAPISVQAAAYQLILDKRVGEYRFPPTWKIVAAGNRETDRANVYKISAPLANRFIHFTVTADLKTWKEWATGRVRQEIIDFLLLRPALLLVMPTDSEKAFPSPRTWEFTSNLLNIYGYDDAEGVSDELKKVVVAAIGIGTGRELIAFLESYKIKEVGELVKNFLTTGKITMPKAYSMRYAIIKAVYKAYLDGDVDEVTFRKNFVAKISAEEQNTIQSYESANADKLKVRKQQSSVPVTFNKVGTLFKPIGTTETVLVISDTSILPDQGMLLLKGTSPSTEVVQYEKINSMEIRVWRGMAGTAPQRWPAGTNLYRL